MHPLTLGLSHMELGEALGLTETDVMGAVHAFFRGKGRLRLGGGVYIRMPEPRLRSAIVALVEQITGAHHTEITMH